MKFFCIFFAWFCNNFHGTFAGQRKRSENNQMDKLAYIIIMKKKQKQFRIAATQKMAIGYFEANVMK